MSLINCVAKIFAAQKMRWVFVCHYTIFSCSIVYVAFLTSNAMHKLMQSKRNVRLTIESFIFAINLKLELFDKTFSCCVLYVEYKYILNRKWNALIVDVWLRKMLHKKKHQQHIQRVHTIFGRTHATKSHHNSFFFGLFRMHFSFVISFEHNNFKRCLLDHRFYSIIHDFPCRTPVYLLGCTVTPISISIRIQWIIWRHTSMCLSLLQPTQHKNITHVCPYSTLPKVITTHFSHASSHISTTQMQHSHKVERIRQRETEKWYTKKKHTHTNTWLCFKLFEYSLRFYQLNKCSFVFESERWKKKTTTSTIWIARSLSDINKMSQLTVDDMKFEWKYGRMCKT